MALGNFLYLISESHGVRAPTASREKAKYHVGRNFQKEVAGTLLHAETETNVKIWNFAYQVSFYPFRRTSLRVL